MSAYDELVKLRDWLSKEIEWAVTNAHYMKSTTYTKVKNRVELQLLDLSKRDDGQTYFRLINSAYEQVGTLCHTFDEAEQRVNAFRREKRGNWKPYRIETVQLRVIATNG